MNTMLKSYNLKVFLISATIALLIGRASAQSAYFQAINSLHPVAYWPLQETIQPPIADIETNLGSLGSVANAFYESTNIQRGVASAIVSDADAAIRLYGTTNVNGSGSWLAVPRLDSRLNIAHVNTTNGFTVECWMKPLASTTKPVAVVSQTAVSYGLNGGTNVGGWALVVGNGNATQLEGDFYSGSGMNFAQAKKSSGSFPALANLVSNWWYVVIEFTGVTNVANNAHIYINGSGNSTSATVATFSSDLCTPLEIGAAGLNSNRFNGAVDEVAIYTNALTTAQINAHYNAGTNISPASTYSQTILNDNPYLYYRMDAAAYTVPDKNSYPVATNYGSLGSAMNAAYAPGTSPGLTGPVNSAGLDTNSVGINGLNSFVDAGYDNLLDPTGTTPFTVSAWFKLNPGDGNRNETVVGHGSWGLSVSNGTAYFNLGGTSAGIAATTINVNDGNWHMISGSYDGNNCIVQVDAYTNSVASNNGIAGTNLDVLIGGAPDNVSVGNDSQFNEQYFPGRIAEVAFFTNTLTTSQLQHLYLVATGLQISQQPVSAIVNFGAAFTNTVIAAGIPPLSYQWYKDNTQLAAQTNASLILNPTQASDASTNYYVVVMNGNGLSITSTVVSLSVLSNPVITRDISASDTNVTLYADGQATFSVAAVGAPPLSFQWYSNSVAITGATSASFTVIKANPANTVQTYYCIVSNPFNTASSSMATVTIIPVPTASYPTSVIADNPVGFWRLDEGPDNYPNNGVAAHDYWGGNNGFYTNSDLAQPGHDVNEPTETAALFGYNDLHDSDVIGISTNVGFAAPTNNSVAFSVEAWVKGYPQITSAGIVVKGDGSAEQFSLDTAVTNSSGAFVLGFGVRDSAGTYHRVNSSIDPGNSPDVNGLGPWHHLVGVCDEPDGIVAFYIDGLLIGTTNIPVNGGVFATTKPMLIGSKTRAIGAPTTALQFAGNIEDVAVYNYALSPIQIAAHYDSATTSAKIIAQPVDTSANEFGTATFSVGVVGTPPLTNQWYNADTGLPISGATNTTLVLTNLQIGDSNSSYYMVTTNAYGSDQSATATLTVISGQPQILTDVPLQFYAFFGSTVTLSVSEAGTEPLANQWKFDGNNLSDNNRITGSQSTVLTISNVQASDVGSYQVFVTNPDGSTNSRVATLGLINVQPISFYDTGLDWTTNISGHSPSGPVFSNNVLTALDSIVSSETRTFFFNQPQFIGAFRSSFTYQDIGGITANGYGGVVFSAQDDPRGSSALGSGSTGLGVSGITPSVDVALSIDSITGIGFKVVGYGVPGLSTIGGGSYLSPGGIDISSGHPINVGVSFADQQLTLTMTDAVTQVSFSTNVAVGVLANVFHSDTAYVGFTAGGNSANDMQTIGDFSFVSPAGIINQPTNVAVNPGATATFSATAAGTLPLTNQWYSNGMAIPGATNTTLVVTNAQIGVTSYYLLTGNAFGSDQSINATLIVNPAQPPVETVSITDANTIAINWSGEYYGYTLQQNSDLSTTNWIDVTNADTIVNDQHQIILPVASTNMFYRLKQ